ncbi:unnamed protein product [Heligmosomoides polygyrus]|uniref:Apple domain-containing protein n=1 Tax=Heligmosomoides polygyrus TaxID=6339 RepID=A0A183FIB6_HELPZ|nr:unnamed protein product [Heligmosomoides polygyrus]
MPSTIPFNLDLPAMAYVGQRAYMLQQRMECRGLKVYDIDNVQNIEQCKEACREFDCAAVNLFQLGEFAFKCEILSTVYGMNPATGAACYYATDAMAGGGMFGGFGGYGRRR